ncbi:MAG TPA: adenosylcobalamin-dependent ribonucleoside-diphosphate reductase, partial [Limnochordales bacterium]
MAGKPYRWGPVQELIFLDRYSPKAPRDEIQPGDLVVVMTSDDRRYPAKEVGVVEAVEGDQVAVRLKVNGEVIRRPRNRCDKPLETRPEQMWDRLARAAAQVEPEGRRKALEREFRWLLDGFRFVPGGRINAMLGTRQALTAYNCYVIPVRGRTPDVPADSRHAIIDTLGNMVEIMARGGGVGINLSVLRPRLAYVKGVNGKSSGSVSWGALFSFATGLVEQGGSRRGALMLILNVWHPDILEFINAKRDFAAITNANISVGITEEFERALEQDGEWELVFPDTTDPDYDRLWDGDLKKWKALGKPVKVYQRLRARELFRQIVESAWASAEPGFVRLDYANAMSNSWYFAPLISTNPCGEQPLPPWGVCLLGHLNLARFVRDGQVAWEELGRAARLAVRFLDNVIDITPYFFEENERQQKMERRVGMGTMGLGEMLIHLGIRYGSPEAVAFVDKLYGFIAREAYLGSVELAREKGPFPAFDAEKFLQSGFMKTMPEDVREAVRQHGIRNVTLMTQAPTGTTGTMAGTSTGIEPYYAWSYYRYGRLGRKEVFEPVVQEYLEAHPELGGDLKKLPPYFVTALELTPEEHVRMQAAIQRWVDSAISKTANLPAHYTVEQTMELYLLAIKLGCKGVTVYRDRSRDEQVLVARDETAPGQQPEVDRPTGAAEGVEEAPARQAVGAAAGERPAPAAPAWSSPLEVEPRAVIGEVPEEVEGFTYRQKTLVGTARVVVNEHPKGQPFETIIVLGKGGMDITADAEAIGRLISLYLRTPSPVSNLEKLALVVEQLRNIGGAQPFGFGPDRVLSMPDALAKALERYLRTRRS